MKNTRYLLLLLLFGLVFAQGYYYNPPTYTGSPHLTYSCNDSDNGLDKYTKGYVVVNVGGTTSTKYDTCGASNTVIEYYCTADGKAEYTELSCPSGYYCSDGACKVSPTFTRYLCRDYDNGKNEYSASYVKIGSSLIKDYCLDSKTVREYYCSGLYSSSYEDIQCRDGYVCRGGKCILYSHESESGGNNHSNTTSTELPLTYCSDNDGRNIYVQGETKLVNRLGNVVSRYKDFCINSNRVKEYYCLDNNITSTAVTCPSSYYCNSGRCVLKPVGKCEDTDPEQLEGIKGKVTYLGTTKWDTCERGYLVQYYCSEDGIKSLVTKCNGVCRDGRCYSVSTNPSNESEDEDTTPTLVCRDSDPNNLLGNLGYVVKGEEKYYDQCLDEDTLLQYYCGSDQSVLREITKCPENYKCLNGKCVLSYEEGSSNEEGNEEGSAPPLPPGESEHQVTYSFAYGWNMFSVVYENLKVISAPEDCFKGYAFEYDADNHRYKRVPLSNLKTEKGYWIKAHKGGCKLIFEVSNPLSLREWKVRLYKGWNLVGAPVFGEGGSAIDKKYLRGNCDILSGPWYYNPNKKRYVRSEDLSEGRAYWIKVADDCTMYYTIN